MQALTLLILISALAASLQINVWPQPRSVIIGKTNSPLLINPCAIGVASRSLYDFRDHTHFVDMMEKYAKLVFGQEFCKEQGTKTIEIALDVKNKELAPPTTETNENYLLQVDSRQILIQAENYVGFLRAIETLSQLIVKKQEGFVIEQVPITIEDEPEFSYRGILLDTSRHYLKKDDILRVLDAMMYNKLNVFHWHITDDESFPLYLESLPTMNQYGAYDAKLVFTKQDVKDIIDHATKNGIRVIPEVDSPAHARSWGLDPQFKNMMILCAGAGYHGQLDPTIDMTYDVNQKVFADIQNYFPDEYIHLGGDEVDSACWDQRPSIKQWMAQQKIKDYVELQEYYRRQQKKNFKTGKKAVFWKDQNDGLKADDEDIIHYWGKYATISELATLKNKLILSAFDYLYLDVGTQNNYGYTYSTYRTWDLIYSYNPYPPLIAKDRILGSEACLWGEHQTSDTIDNYLWIRGSALAERLWNTQSQKKQEIVRRLVAYKNTLLARGIKASPVYTENCEIKPESCYS